MLCYSTAQHLVDWRINVAEKVSQVASSLLQFFSFHNVLFSFFFKILSTVVFVFTKKNAISKELLFCVASDKNNFETFYFFSKDTNFLKDFSRQVEWNHIWSLFGLAKWYHFWIFAWVLFFNVMTNGTVLIVCQIKNQTEKKQKTSDQQVKKLMRQVTCRSEKTPHQCDKCVFF